MCRPGAVFCARMASAQHFLLACAAVRQVSPRRAQPVHFPTVLAGAVMGCVPKQPWSAALERDSGAARKPKPKRLSVPFTVPVGTAGTFHGWRAAWLIRSRSGKAPNELRDFRHTLQPNAPAPQFSVSMYSRPPAVFGAPLPYNNGAKRPRARNSAHGGVLSCRTCGAHRSSR